MKNKISYILYNERPQSGIINNQVIELLKEIAKNSNIEITLIFIWQPIFYFSYYKKIELLNSDLKASNIKTENYYFALPNRFFFTKKILLNALIIYLSFLFSFLNLNRFKIVHCRSYISSFIVSSKSKKEKKYQTIFDVRSLLPEENITVGTWSYKSDIYKLWKKIEYLSFKYSNYVITVSKTMEDKIKKIYNKTNTKNIYLIGSIEKVNFSKKKRIQIRKKLNFENKFAILYTGSFGTKIWNNIYNYAELISSLKTFHNELIFVFVVPKIEPYFIKIFDSYFIPKNCYIFIDGLNKNIFQACDAGINILSKGPDYRTRFGVKVAEYFAYGLPVILKNVGGAEEFVQKFNAGIILKNRKNNSEEFSIFLKKKYDRLKIANLSRKYFSIKAVSQDYLKLYLS